MSDERAVIAAIDVGTNSARLVVAEAFADGRLRVLDDEKETTRLGIGMEATGRLDPERIGSTVEIIGRMHSIARGYGATHIRVVGTSAARVASNGPVFVEALREAHGIDLEVLSGEQEAKLAFASVASAFELDQMNAAVADIGGGSVELVLAAGGVVQQVESVDVGAIRLTDRFGRCENDERAFEAMRHFVRQTLRERLAEPAFTPLVLFGTGGTFTSLATMEADRRGLLKGNDQASIRGFELNRAELRHHLDLLRTMTVEERTKIAGVSRDRAEIAVAGLVLAEGIARHLSTNMIRVHDRGIREGLLRVMMDDIFPASGKDSDRSRLDAVREFGERCRYDSMSAGHVASLALRIFNALRDTSHFGGPWASDQHRTLLESAALLHDVGYFINYSKHHKHSYHLIVHSDIPGFSHRELQIIAQVARYHRRSDPKAKHAPFAALSEEDRDVVRKLAGILRVAVGLERTHQQAVQDARVRTTPGEIEVIALATSEPAAEVHGAAKKRSLMATAFGCRVEVRWEQLKDHDSTVEHAL